MNGVLGHDSVLIRLYWAGDNLGWLILIGIMSPVQDRSLDLLTSSPVRYHCTTDAPLGDGKELDKDGTGT